MFDKTFLSGSRSIKCLASDLVNVARQENVPNELINSTVRELNELSEKLERIHKEINSAARSKQ